MGHTIADRHGRNDDIAMLRVSRSIGPLGRPCARGRAVLPGASRH
jgi:hypothetical protein